jgi:hypothetical protein
VGLENLVKAMVFYYFTVAFVRTERDLKRFLFVFIACEVIRILEPLTLHFTTGYWGSKASMMGGAESLYRLSGGPFDTVNPNGFAFIICTVFPFLFYFSTVNWKTRLAFFVLAPACLVALALTGSRSGLIGFGIVCLAILGKAKNRAALAAVIVAGGIIGFSLLESDMQDRYLSTFGLGTKNEATANERTEANIQQFYVVLRRPLFGHGLGTSPEANYHYSETGPYGGRDIPAHNLYLEIGQELGIFGLIIFLAFIVEILKSFARSRRACRQDGANTFYARVIDAMQVWVAMNVVFSFASYGLSNYDWYLIGGLSVVMLRLAQQKTANETGVAPGSTRPPRALPLTSRMKQTST